MKTTLTAFFFSLFYLVASGQKMDFQAPDYKGIKSAMNDQNSAFFYPKLMQRYVDSDTTLTLQDFRILYYGFLFTNDYSPYGFSAYSDSLKTIFNKDTLTADDYNLIINYEGKILKEFPFNLRDLNTLSYTYRQLGDTISMVSADFKLKMIIHTILSTGDGKKEKTAWHVIDVGHEYDILAILGFNLVEIRL